MAKPFVKWAGGKTRLLTQFHDILPDNLNRKDTFTYIEPFVGGGAMLFFMLQNYPNIEKAIINDINPNLATAYRIIRDFPEDLIIELRRFQAEFSKLNSELLKKEYYLSIRNSYNHESHTEIGKTAMFIFLNRTCFNGLHRVNSKGYFNVPFGKYDNPTICDEKLIIEDSCALQNVNILCGDYTQIEHFVNDSTFIYFDPPYRPLSATSSFTSYAKDDFNDDEQVRLGEFYKHLSNMGCQMMLSNSDCSAKNSNDTFFEDLYGDFIIDRVFAARSVNANPLKRGKLSELIIRNYESTTKHPIRNMQLAI